MVLAARISNTIKQIPVGSTFGYGDLRIAKEEYAAAAKALERLRKTGLVKRAAKGVFYRPELTVFGTLGPDRHELLRRYLFEDGRRIAYETGTSLYRRLGFTTQMAFRIKIACQGRRLNINWGSVNARSVKSYAEVTDGNYEILGLLDALKDIKRIPDCTVAQAVRRSAALLKKLDEGQAEALMGYALLYPARARALAGAILQDIGHGGNALERLRMSLNPLSIIKIEIEDRELPTKSYWNIK